MFYLLFKNERLAERVTPHVDCHLYSARERQRCLSSGTDACFAGRRALRKPKFTLGSFKLRGLLGPAGIPNLKSSRVILPLLKFIR